MVIMNSSAVKTHSFNKYTECWSCSRPPVRQVPEGQIRSLGTNEPQGRHWASAPHLSRMQLKAGLGSHPHEALTQPGHVAPERLASFLEFQLPHL